MVDGRWSIDWWENGDPKVTDELGPYPMGKTRIPSNPKVRGKTKIEAKETQLTHWAKLDFGLFYRTGQNCYPKRAAGVL